MATGPLAAALALPYSSAYLVLDTCVHFIRACYLLTGQVLNACAVRSVSVCIRQTVVLSAGEAGSSEPTCFLEGEFADIALELTFLISLMIWVLRAI